MAYVTRYTLETDGKLLGGKVGYFVITDHAHNPHHPALLIRSDPFEPGYGIALAKRICDDLNAHDQLNQPMEELLNFQEAFKRNFHKDDGGKK